VENLHDAGGKLAYIGGEVRLKQQARPGNSPPLF
jgi:hypothetical protein